MNSNDRFALVVVLVLVTFISVMSVITFRTIVLRTQARTPTITHEHNLPCKCAPLYNSGTDEWINCLGVGYK